MKRVLIVKMFALGDILMATVLLTNLRARFPGIKITWLVDAAHAGLLQANPLIDELIAFDSGRWRRLFRNGKFFPWLAEGLALNNQLRLQQLDAVINCHPDKWWTRFFCPAPVRVGLFRTARLPWTRRLYTHPCPKPTHFHSSDRYFKGLEALGLSGEFDRHMSLFVAERDQEWAQKFLCAQSGFRPGLPIIILHPGTSRANKCWPTESFAAVAAALAPASNVVITGSPSEEPLARAIIAALCENRSEAVPKPLVAIGCLDGLGATAALVQQASAVVTGDTVMLHMASALETPLVGIFGSTRPGENLPLYGPQALLYDDSVACAPCYKGHCPLKGSQYLQCQRAVTPKQVLSALTQLSAESARKEDTL